MRYYKKHNETVELTLAGQFVLTYLGLTVDDLRGMSKQQLINYVVKMGRALDTGKTTKSSGGTKPIPTTGRIYGEYDKRNQDYYNYGDVGGASRYFDLDAWARHHGFLDVPKASKGEREQGLADLKSFKEGHIASETGGGGGWKKDSHKNPNLPRKNFHPTVKPIKLMAYLIELGCPPNGVVLDPFLGSGTTMLASQRLGRSCVGIELNPEYCLIAKARCFPKQKQLLAKYKFEVME